MITHQRRLRRGVAAGRASYKAHMARLVEAFGDGAKAQFAKEASERGKLGGRPTFHAAVRKANKRAEARRQNK